jgi:subtilase family serine protease
VANLGSAPASGIGVDVVIARQQDIAGGDYVVIGQGEARQAAPGNSVVAALSGVTLPQWPSGDYYLGAVVDPRNAWAEENESNNSAVTPIRLSPPTPPPQPDLIAQLDGSREFQPGEVIGDKLYLVVGNAGDAEAGAFHADFYVTLDGNLDVGDTRIGGADVSGLPPGQSPRIYLFDMQIPAIWPAGEAYIAAQVDAGNAQAEKDENNNLAFFAINVIDPGEPDLYVSQFMGPQTAQAGDDIAQGLHLVVSNKGKAGAGSFTLNIVIGETVLNAYQDQRVMRSVQVNGVAPGQLLTVPLDGVVIPPDWSAGDASYLGVELDVFDEQPESDEKNNADYKPIYVVPRLLPPAAPSGLGYYRSGGCVIVSLYWADNANNEEGFYVFRDDELIATLDANITSYNDEPDTTVAHLYSVSAYNASGQSATATVSVPAQDCSTPSPATPGPIT